MTSPKTTLSVVSRSSCADVLSSCSSRSMPRVSAAMLSPKCCTVPSSMLSTLSFSVWYTCLERGQQRNARSKITHKGMARGERENEEEEKPTNTKEHAKKERKRKKNKNKSPTRHTRTQASKRKKKGGGKGLLPNPRP